MNYQPASRYQPDALDRRAAAVIAFISFVAIVSLGYGAAALAQEPEALEPVSKTTVLFDGSDLNQWLFYSNSDTVQLGDVFSVQGGVLKCTGRPAGYLQTKRWYRDYVLELQWRWPGDRGGNSGVLVHATTPLLFYGWPKSIEVQLHSGNAGDFWVIGQGVDLRVGDEASRRVKPVAGNQHAHRRINRLAGDVEKPLGQWNTMRIVCADQDIKVYVNSKLVNHGTQVTVRRGAIALQSEGTAVEFKNITISPVRK